MKAGWEIATVGAFCRFENGDRGKNYPGRKAFVPAGVPFVNAGHLGEGLLDLSEMNYIPRDHFERLGSGKIQIGDLLFCLRGSLGKYAVVDNLDEGAIASSLVIVRPNEMLAPRYLGYYFGSPLCSDEITQYANGAAQPNLSAKSLAAFKLPLPPLEEQHRIVEVLDKAFEGLARARAHAEANLQNARELFTANVDTLLSRVGDDWSVGPLSKLIGQVATGPFGSLLHKSDYVENETPLVNPANIVDGRIIPDMRKTVNKSALERLSSYILDADDIVIGRRGEIGRCAVVEVEQAGWLCGTGSFFIRPNSDVVSRFIAHVLRSPSYVAKLEAASTGATMANLSNRVLSDLEVALPKRDQQLDYLEVIDGFDEAAVQLEGAFAAKLQDLDDLRQSLLQKAFAGELT